MNTKEQASQLRLAADILETGHPFLVSHIPHGIWCAPVEHQNSVIHWPLAKYQFKIILATPPDGRPLHNPDNLTAEEVGVGYRLGLQDESANQPHEFWSKIGAKWVGAIPGSFTFGFYKDSTYRLPLSVPWPELLDPYAETAPLGPRDVPPGSIIKANSWASHEWRSVDHVYSDGALLSNCPTTHRWEDLMRNYQINRSIPLTGKWNPDAWEKCSKEVPA